MEVFGTKEKYLTKYHSNLVRSYSYTMKTYQLATCTNSTNATH